MIIDMKVDITFSGLAPHKVDWQEMEDAIKESLKADEVEIIDADTYQEDFEDDSLYEDWDEIE